MLSTHVDDMLRATKPGYEQRVQALLDPFMLYTLESDIFCCGRAPVLSDDFSKV